MRDPLRHQRSNAHLAGAFGNDRFGRLAERFARAFGTPRFIITQTLIVVAWVIVNALAVAWRWDPYPFILLNLAFSTQAAYAAPMILLSQTRQADRDKASAEAAARHREDVAQDMESMLRELHSLVAQNTDLTKEVRGLTGRVHELVGELTGRR